MKKLLSVSYADWAFNMAMLVLRVATGALIIPHGYNKLVGFGEMKNNFMNFLGMGSTLSLSMVIFAEFFCGMFLVLGLFTRLAAIPLVIAMSVAVFKAHNAEVFGKGELGTLYLAACITLLLCGPGKVSADGLINK